MRKKWEYRELDDEKINSIASKFGVPKLLATVLVSRGIVDDEEITPVRFGRKESILYVSRIRKIKGRDSSFTMTAVMDNFLRGSALNCLGIIRKLGLK